MKLPALTIPWHGHHSRKRAFPESSLPTATLPKATLLFSPILPEVKLLMKIPSCTAARAHPSCPQVAALNTEAMAAAMPATHALASKRNPSRFCFHFFSFTFFLLFFLHFSFLPS